MITIKADVVARLQELQDENGRLTTDVVLTDAQNPTSPLHSEFEWDNAEAAVKYRQQQAAALISTVRLEVTIHHREIRIPAYVRDPKIPGFRSVIAVRSEEDQARAALADGIARLLQQARRVRALAEYFELGDRVDDIDEIARDVLVRAQPSNDQPQGSA